MEMILSDEVATATGETVSKSLEVFRTFYDPDLDFRKLASELTGIARGFRLVEKDDLLDVPHIIISATYREGYKRNEDGTEIQGDYVSFEAIVADAELLTSPQIRAKLDIGNLKVYPNEAVVYNDGGTGCRRKFTQVLDEAGMIDVGGKGDDDRRWDRPYSLWKSGADLATSGITADVNGNKLRYGAPRGLRKSEYESPFGPAETFYFA